MKRRHFVLYWCKEFFFWEKILPNIGCAERCFCALLRIEVYFFQFCCFLTGGFEWGRMIRGIAVEIMMAPCYDNSVLKQRVRPDVKVCGFFMWYMWLELLLWKVLTVNSNFDAPCLEHGVFLVEYCLMASRFIKWSDILQKSGWPFCKWYGKGGWHGKKDCNLRHYRGGWKQCGPGKWIAARIPGVELLRVLAVTCQLSSRNTSTIVSYLRLLSK